MKFQLSETIWWWIEPCGEAPFLGGVNLLKHLVLEPIRLLKYESGSFLQKEKEEKAVAALSSDFILTFMESRSWALKLSKSTNVNIEEL